MGDSLVLFVFVNGVGGGETSRDREEVLGMIVSTSEAMDVRMDVRMVDDCERCDTRGDVDLVEDRSG